MEQSRLGLMLYAIVGQLLAFHRARDARVAELPGLYGPWRTIRHWEIYFTSYCSVFRVLFGRGSRPEPARVISARDPAQSIAIHNL